MKPYMLTLLLSLSTWMLNAQANKGYTTSDTSAGKMLTQHHLVFQLSTADTLAHKALMKQIRNITSVAPGTEIEVVCHGPGLNMLVNDKSTVHKSIAELHNEKIRFVACEFSMKERSVNKDQIIPEAGFVKAGILEIAIRQEQGWSYIKAGF